MSSDRSKTATATATILLGYLGAAATVLDQDWDQSVKSTIIFIGAVVVSIAISLEVREYRAGKPIYRGTRQGSHEVTARLMKQDGKTAVFTVGLSFTDNQVAYDALITEASKNSIILMLPRSVPEAQKIIKNGGDVRIYAEELADREWEPQTRFTIVPFGEPGSILYIGRDLPNGKFVIEKFRAGSAAHAIACDLVSYLQRKFPASETDRSGA